MDTGTYGDAMIFDQPSLIGVYQQGNVAALTRRRDNVQMERSDFADQCLIKRSNENQSHGSISDWTNEDGVTYMAIPYDIDSYHQFAGDTLVDVPNEVQPSQERLKMSVYWDQFDQALRATQDYLMGTP